MARRDPEPRFVVVHRDAHLLVVNKPPGLPTTSPDGGERSLTDLLRAHVPNAAKMHPSSRLDRDVTGLVTYALTTRAIDALLEARSAGQYRRAYVAIVQGVPDADAGVWSWAIGIDPRDPKKRVALAPDAQGERVQEAATDWTLRGAANGAAVLELSPRTGRTHQLRVHCAAAGLPILGDVAYVGPPRIVLADGRVVTARRPLLHCARLAIPDVAHGGELALVAEISDDMSRAWEQLGGDTAVLR